MDEASDKKNIFKKFKTDFKNIPNDNQEKRLQDFASFLFNYSVEALELLNENTNRELDDLKNLVSSHEDLADIFNNLSTLNERDDIDLDAILFEPFFASIDTKYPEEEVAPHAEPVITDSSLPSSLSAQSMAPQVTSSPILSVPRSNIPEKSLSHKTGVGKTPIVKFDFDGVADLTGEGFVEDPLNYWLVMAVVEPTNKPNVVIEIHGSRESVVEALPTIQIGGDLHPEALQTPIFTVEKEIDPKTKEVLSIAVNIAGMVELDGEAPRPADKRDLIYYEKDSSLACDGEEPPRIYILRETEGVTESFEVDANVLKDQDLQQELFLDLSNSFLSPERMNRIIEVNEEPISIACTKIDELGTLISKSKSFKELVKAEISANEELKTAIIQTIETARQFGTVSTGFEDRVSKIAKTFGLSIPGHEHSHDAIPGIL